jgi:Tfp pilus assembly protein PilO
MALPKQSSLLWVDVAGVGVCVLASIVGYMVLVNPFLQKRAAAVDLRREMETREQKVTELASALGAAQERLTAMRQQLAASAVQLESAAHINRRIAGMTEFFSSCTLHVDDVQTGRVSNGLQYDLVPITIVGRGPYPQCAQLLHGLCEKYPDMSVLHIDLSGSPGQPADTEKFRLELFWYAAPSGPVQKTAGEAAGPGPVSQS